MLPVATNAQEAKVPDPEVYVTFKVKVVPVKAVILPSIYVVGVVV
jgi:hypothetical protein